MAAPVSVLSFAGHSSRVHRLQNLAQAAADAGAHHLDSTGEVGFVRKLRARHNTRARNTGATMVPAFGYDYVPGNLAAALAARVGGSAVRDRHRLLRHRFTARRTEPGLKAGGGRQRSAGLAVQPIHEPPFRMMQMKPQH